MAKAQAQPQTEAAANAFIGLKRPPTDEELEAALGRPAKALWDKLLARLTEEHGLHVSEWNSYSPKAGWSLRVKKAERNILYLGPLQGTFRIAFVLGDKAVKAARASGLPPEVLQNLSESRRYAEGTALRLNISGPRDIDTVVTLAAIKLAN